VWQAHKGLPADARPSACGSTATRTWKIWRRPGSLSAVALNFPKFTDGRAYSGAALLRTRYGFKGEIRAIGDVLRDQFFFMQRCGFDAIQPKAGKYSDAQLEEAWPA
jgi:uncharacterized protein (DUF934 family)